MSVMVNLASKSVRIPRKFENYTHHLIGGYSLKKSKDGSLTKSINLFFSLATNKKQNAEVGVLKCAVGNFPFSAGRMYLNI
jgi:hypothetical protein